MRSSSSSHYNAPLQQAPPAFAPPQRIASLPAMNATPSTESAEVPSLNTQAVNADAQQAPVRSLLQMFYEGGFMMYRLQFAHS